MLRRHPILSLATFSYLAVVGWLTLGPQPLDDEGRGLLRRVIAWLRRHDATEWVTYSGVEFTANVLMFVPVGLFFVLLLGRRRWWLAVMLGVALTLGIETAQLFLVDRVPDPRDLLANSIGAALGVVGALLITWPGPAQARTARVPQRARSSDRSVRSG